jgi:Uma2 family endonuclease
MTSPQPQRFYTVQEYLQREEAAAYKSEYYRGEIFPLGDLDGPTPEAMAGAKPNHNVIKSNVEFLLQSALRKRGGCQTFSSDQRVHINAFDLYTYPDVLVVCGKPEFDDDDPDALTNPIVIVEITSRSSASYDRGEKFKFYRGLPSLREYLLIDSLKLDAVVYRRMPDGLWALASEGYRPDELIQLESLGTALLVADVYENTTDLTTSPFISKKR